MKFEPDTSHIQPERKELADIEFKNRDVDTIEDAELIKDKIRSLELRLRLHRLHVPKALRKRVTFECDIPSCSEVLFTRPQYMLHQAECHKIFLLSSWV